MGKASNMGSRIAGALKHSSGVLKAKLESAKKGLKKGKEKIKEFYHKRVKNKFKK